MDEKDIGEGGSPLRDRLIIQQVRAQQFVQLLQAVVVHRDTDVQEPRSLSEFDARHGPYAVARRIAHEVGDARRAVDVGEGEGAHAGLGRFFEQGFGFQYAILEAEPGVAVEEHGREEGRFGKLESGDTFDAETVILSSVN
jgi:hypothetical protein